MPTGAGTWPRCCRFLTPDRPEPRALFRRVPRGPLRVPSPPSLADDPGQAEGARSTPARLDGRPQRTQAPPRVRRLPSGAPRLPRDDPRGPRAAPPSERCRAAAARLPATRPGTASASAPANPARNGEAAPPAFCATGRSRFFVELLVRAGPYRPVAPTRRGNEECRPTESGGGILAIVYVAESRLPATVIDALRSSPDRRFVAWYAARPGQVEESAEPRHNRVRAGPRRAVDSPTDCTRRRPEGASPLRGAGGKVCSG